MENQSEMHPNVKNLIADREREWLDHLLDVPKKSELKSHEPKSDLGDQRDLMGKDQIVEKMDNQNIDPFD
ncbi:unnamed protein product, partial [Mesorhabditis belari]|uniref:Uncharacterized protein n=1 Tax=Mesorhabditis belari TaxID=2138241 RepID=A0AAF3J8A4_9BILA